MLTYAGSSSGSAIFAAAEYKDKWRQLLGTQFTCFPGTKVHILTQKALLDIIPDLPVSQLSDGQVLSLLALLVQQHKYGRS
jgi:hypothetical protein